MGARWNHRATSESPSALPARKAVATSRPKLSTQPRPELRPQAGPEVLRQPTSCSMLPRLCWCNARSIEAMHAPAVKLHHLAAQFYLTLAPPTAASPAFKIVRTYMVQITPAPDLRACITHMLPALPCLRLRYPTLLLMSFRCRTLQVPFTSTPTATAHYHHHHHRLRHPPTSSARAPLSLRPLCIFSCRCQKVLGGGF